MAKKKSKYLLDPKHPLRTLVYILIALGFLVGGYFTLNATSISTESRSKAAETEQIINQWEFDKRNMQFWTKINFATGNFDSTNWNTSVMSDAKTSTIEQARIPKPLPKGTKKLRFQVKVNNPQTKGGAPTPSGNPYSGEVRYMLAGKTTWEQPLPFSWKIDAEPYEHVLNLPEISEVTIPKLQISFFPLPSGTQVSFDYIRLTAIPLPTPTPVSVFGNAIKLNGTDACVDILYPTAKLNVAPYKSDTTWTIEGWFKPDYIDMQSNSPDNILAREYRGNYYASYEVMIIKGKLNFKVDTYAGYQSFHYANIDGQTQLQVGKWYHFAAVRNNDQLHLYLNGREDAPVAILNQFNGSSIDGALSFGCQRRFLSGRGWWWNRFSGEVDEVRISSTIRYLSNFTAPTQPFQRDSETLGLWHFDENDNSLYTADSSGGRENDGRVLGNVHFVRSTILDSTISN